MYFEKISIIPKIVSINLDRSYSCFGGLSRFLNICTLWRTNTEVTTRVNYVYGCNRCGNSLDETAPPEFSVCVKSVIDLLNKCSWLPMEMIEIDKFIRNFYNNYQTKKLQTEQIEETKREIENTGSNAISSKSKSAQNSKKKSTKDILPVISNQLISLAPLIATDLTWLSMSLHLTAVKCSRPPINCQVYMQSLYNEVIKSITSDNKHNSSNHPINNATHFKITCPIITILNCPGRIGALQSGKCKFLQEILLIPRSNLKPKELLDNLFMIKTKLSQVLLNKSNLAPQIICDNGASSVNIDKVEQALDLLAELLEQIQLKNEFYFGLYITPKGIFDTVKERYEPIIGSLKTPEELVNYYVELIGKYPQIRLLIDPFRAEDKECWALLKTRITNPIWITTSTTIQPAMKELSANQSSSMVTAKPNPTTISTTPIDEQCKFSIPTGLTINQLANLQENIIHTPDDDDAFVSNDVDIIEDDNHDLKQAENNNLIIHTADKQDLCYSTWLFTLDTCLDCVLMTEIIEAIYKLHSQNRKVIFSLDNLQIIEDWPMDMAIGFGMDFIKITGLYRIDQCNKLIRWYEYYQQFIDHQFDDDEHYSNNSINQWKLYDDESF
ncbi:unnamed protein product [Schistosoma turkestanicum]|nr:unnamed protein product [Schistosoma turkestanicum]